MILKIKLIIYCLLIIIFSTSCQGTHGMIKSYTAKSSKKEVEEGMKSISDNVDYITFFDNTDDSGINRKGYIDILIETKGLKKRYKVHFYGDEVFWEQNLNFCDFAIIKINGKTDNKFGFWSKEKRIAIELFEKEFIPLLESVVGPVEFEK